MTGQEWLELGKTNGYLLWAIRVLAAGRGKTPPIKIAELVVAAQGNISRRQVFVSMATLRAAKKIRTRDTRHGIVFTLLETKAQASFRRKIAALEARFGTDAPDEIIQVAATPIRREIKTARRALAKERDAEAQRRQIEDQRRDADNKRLNELAG